LAADDFIFRDAVRCGYVERDIDAALFKVARNILPEISELERSAGGV